MSSPGLHCKKRLACRAVQSLETRPGQVADQGPIWFDMRLLLTPTSAMPKHNITVVNSSRLAGAQVQTCRLVSSMGSKIHD